MELTEKQKRFIDFYIETGNATDAARRAGYKQPNIQGAQNLVKLSNEISARNTVLESKRIADMTEVKEFWSAVLRDKRGKVPDRLKASEYIAKTNAAFVDKVEHSGDLEFNIKIDYGDADGEDDTV